MRPLLAALLLFFSAPRAQATAGFAEHEASYHYDDHVLLWWGHSDICIGVTSTKNCLRFVKHDQVGWTMGLLFDQVSVPPNPKTGLAIVHGLEDGQWRLVETATAKELARAGDVGGVLAMWKARGLPPPKIVKIDDVDDAFSETWESRRDRYVWMGLIWGAALGFPLGVLIVPAVIAWLIVRFVWRKKKA